MKQEDKFDKIIKEKLDENEFPFDESNWLKASKMLDAEKGANIGAKSSKLFLMVGAILIGVAAGTFAFLYLGHQEQLQSFNSITLDMNNSDRENHSINQVIESEKGELSENTSINSKQSDAGAENISNESASINAHEGSIAQGTRPSNTSNRNPTLGNNSSNPGGSNIGSSSVGKTNITGGHSTYKQKSNKLNKKETENVVSADVFQSANNLASTASADYLEMHSSILDMYTREEAIKSSPNEFIRINEDYYNKSRRRLHFINAEAGLSYFNGWNSLSQKDAAGLNYFAGLNYGIYIKKKMSISAGIQYYNISHIKTAFYTRQNFQYDFGYNGNFTNITTNSLQYLSVPLRAYYNISRTGKLGLGVNAAYLVNASNTVETYTERDLVKTNVVTETKNGVFEGVNPMNIMLSANFSHRLNRRWFVNVEFNYGLSDTYQSKATGNNTKENNKGIRVGLQYTLFEK
ncbi:MAG: PorT family protein [Sphingobacteriaceae bacterium]|nr:PorT family protein [Sphingobacteriaceae bacterium]